jgi:hypothetical protein
MSMPDYQSAISLDPTSLQAYLAVSVGFLRICHVFDGIFIRIR